MESRVREEGSLEQRGGKWWRKRAEAGHGVETAAVLISNPAASGVFASQRKTRRLRWTNPLLTPPTLNDALIALKRRKITLWCFPFARRLHMRKKPLRDHVAFYESWGVGSISSRFITPTALPTVNFSVSHDKYIRKAYYIYIYIVHVGLAMNLITPL